MNLLESFLRCQDNADSWPVVLEPLARKLGVSVESLQTLGVGWSIGKGAWVFPERNDTGDITGLVYRRYSGDQWCEKGSKRGLTYPLSKLLASVDLNQTYDPAKQTWDRVATDNPCPICGHEKWCSFDGSHNPPEFVRCMHVSEGAVYVDRDGGSIHELIQGGFKPLRSNGSILSDSPKPILVVEGASDVAAALTLGYLSVGRPSAKGKSDSFFVRYLINLLAGRDVAIIGENDSGIGVEGMEAMFAALRKTAKSLVKVLPPVGVKDLREWVRSGVTEKQIAEAIGRGDNTTDPNILEDINPLPLAKLWLRSEPDPTFQTLQSYRNKWHVFDGTCYHPLEDNSLIRNKLYNFLGGKQYLKQSRGGSPTLELYAPDKYKVDCIADALYHLNPVTSSPPAWIKRPTGRAPADRILVFKNGQLDLDAYAASRSDMLQPNTSDFFSLTVLPYDFSPEAKCPRWLKFLEEILPARPEAQVFLQEWFGYHLSPGNWMETCVLLYGIPASGKSTVISVLQAMLGIENCATTTMQDISSPFGKASLVDKLAIVMPDAHNFDHAVHALETLKAITGCDTVNVNRKYKNDIQSRIGGKITIGMNELPQLLDKALALRRRTRIVRFEVSFEGREDFSLKEKLQAEVSGIVLWAIRGLERLMARRKFARVGAIDKETARELSALNSPVTVFAEECLIPEFGTDKCDPCSTVYACWVNWAKAHGVKSGSSAQLSQNLRAVFPRLSISRLRSGGHVRRYFGLALSEQAKKDYLG